MKKILVIGAGGHAESCINVIKSCQDFEIFGLVSSDLSIGTYKFGFPIVGVDSDLPHLLREVRYACIGFGQISDPTSRIQMFDRLKLYGYNLPSLISSTSQVSSTAKIGEGTIIMHGALINSGVDIGANCIINTGVILEHGVSIGPNSHVSTGAVINGDSNIGKNTFIGSGSIIKQGSRIREKSFIKMGSIVISDN